MRRKTDGADNALSVYSTSAQFVTLDNATEAFSIVKECLLRSGYKRIQYFPKAQARYFGRELFLIRSFLLKDTVSLFRTSGAHSIYDRIMRYIYPELYVLYRLFFRCEEFPLSVFREFFNQQEIDSLTRNGVISGTGGRRFCNYRFVPFEDLLVVSSPDLKYDTADYVHIGGDSVAFLNMLKKETIRSVTDALEIGCGAGLLSLWMSRFAQNVTATDIQPRALDFTRFNAKFNGINNIVARISDVYSDIRGRFDLIISNPPFVFLPEDCSVRTFAYGGYFGTKIVKKILFGLDDRLKDDGISFVMATSYMQNDGTNTLYDLIESIFQDKPYSITLEQIAYQPITNHMSFYRKHGIVYSIRYMVTIRKASAYKLDHVPIQGLSKALEILKVKLLSKPM